MGGAYCVVARKIQNLHILNLKMLIFLRGTEISEIRIFRRVQCGVVNLAGHSERKFAKSLFPYNHNVMVI